jgi:hypothetical protein
VKHDGVALACAAIVVMFILLVTVFILTHYRPA